MNAQTEMRKYIRKLLQESINNFIDKEEQTNTKQLKDTSAPQMLGDPLNVELNQMADELGSDEANSPTVSAIAGEAKGGNEPTTGQHKAVFSDKTKLA